MTRFCIGLMSMISTAVAASLPLYFEPNRGQAHSSVQYLARGNGVPAYLAGDQAAFSVGGSSVVMRLVDARPGRARAVDRLPGTSNYFRGREASRWSTRVPQYGKVVYHDVYPGIDLVYHGAGGHLEYDFRIQPGANPGAVRITYPGATRLRLDGGDLLLSTATGTIRQRRPVAYQNTGGKRRSIDACYRLEGRQVGVHVADYDRTRPLIIDPVIEYATYFGGSAMDGAHAIKVDARGDVYIAGSVAMPASATDPFSPTSEETYDSAAVVIKYSPSRKAILYVAQLGSDGASTAGQVDIDAAGALYLTGSTNSASFPIANAAYGTNRAGSFTPFVAKIAPDGHTLVFSTYFGGTGLDQYGGIAAGPDGSTYVTGTAVARDFPVTEPASDGSHSAKAFLARFSGDGALQFSKLFGGTTGSTQGYGIALDSSGNVYIAGATSSQNLPVKNAFQSSFRKEALLSSMLNLRAAFAAKFTADGKTLVYSTLLGGDGDDVANAVAVDAQGSLHLAGSTTSADFPVLNAIQSQLGGVQNGFLAALNPQGNALVFSTFFGGSQKDSIQSLALDAAGNIYAAGTTGSSDFPALSAPAGSRLPSALNDSNAFAAKLAAGGRALLFAAPFGGAQYDTGTGIASDASGSAYLAGTTGSADLPVANAIQSVFGKQRDMFLAKIVPDAASPVSLVVLPSSVSFTHSTGRTAANAQVINLAPPAGGAAGTFSAAATTSSGGNWLSITPGAGNSPGQIAVSANPAGLATGVYHGTVRILPADGSPVEVPVSLRVVPPTPVLTSVSPAEFDVAHFDVLNPPAALPTIVLTISGGDFVSGATAWVTAFAPAYTVPYPTTFLDSSTLQMSLPLSVQATPLSITVSNPGTPPSNPLNLAEGKPVMLLAGIGGTVAPGQVVVLSGLNVGPLAPFVASQGNPVTTLGNTQVLFDGVPAQMVSAYHTQVRAVVPAGVAGKTSTRVVVKYLSHSSTPFTAAVAGNTPPPDPFGPGISGVLNPDGSVNGPGNPTSAGAVITLLIDQSQLPPGQRAPSSVTIGSVPAAMAPMEAVAGHAGKLQFQVQVPSGVPANSAAPVVVHFLDTEITARVNVAVQ